MDIALKYSTMIVRDMDESVQFYSDVLGFKVDSQYNPQPGVRITLMKGKGDIFIELIENKEYETGLYSMGMDVKNLNETLLELKSRGVKITMEPVPILVGNLAFAEDPNGVRIALIQHNK
jgi:lactoylglutathione lyase